MRRGTWKLSVSPESRGCSGRALGKVHCGAWCRAWQSSWISSLVLRRSRRRPASPSRRRGRHCRVYSLPNVAWWRPVGPAGQGLAFICALAVMGRVAVPDPPGRSAGGPGPGPTTWPAPYRSCLRLASIFSKCTNSLETEIFRKNVGDFWGRSGVPPVVAPREARLCRG